MFALVLGTKRHIFLYTMGIQQFSYQFIPSEMVVKIPKNNPEKAKIILYENSTKKL